MEIQVTRDGDAARVAFSGSFRIDIAPRVRKALLGAVDAGAKSLVVDLSKVDYIDSSNIATLVEVLQRLDGGGGEMRIAGANEHVYGIFDLMGLSRLFRFEGRE